MIEYNCKGYLIRTASFWIGRSTDCDLVVDDKSVSRKHCMIQFVSGKFLLSDLHSQNGTYLNNQRIFESVELHNRDKIRLGFVELEFSVREEQTDGRTEKTQDKY